MKLLVGFLSLVLIMAIYWNFFSSDETKDETKVVTKSNNYEKKELNFTKSKVSDKVTNEDEIVKKTEAVHYKDIFKEPKEMQTNMEKIVEQEELRNLDEEVTSLITEADKLIEKQKLVVPKKKISQALKATYEVKIEDLEKKLEKLETE